MAAAADLGRRAVAEALGTALLLATVVGSGIMGEKLAGGNVADRAAREHARDRAPGSSRSSSRSGRSPARTSTPPSRSPTRAKGASPGARCPPTSAAQIAGAFAGVGHRGRHVRASRSSSPPRTSARAPRSWSSEFVATFGLLAVIWGCARRRSGRGAVRRRRVHHGGVLVHVVHLVRQPRRHARARGERHVRRHPAGRRPGVHRRPARRGRRGHGHVPLARPSLPDGRPRRPWSL